MRPLSWRPQGRGSSSCRPTAEPDPRRAGRRLHLSRGIRHITALAVVAVAAAAAPQAAQAANYHDAIRDCNDDGVLQGQYSRSTLRQARNHLPASLREYSDCADVLARALAAAGKKGGNGGGDSAPPLGDPNLTTGSGAIASNPDQLNALKEKTKRSTDDRAPEKVTVGGAAVTPGTAGLSSKSLRASPNELPQPLLIALIALAATGAVAGAFALRQRWPETRRAAIRLLSR